MSPRLPDGRTLGLARYGDPTGWPIFYFHGFPGSRLEWQLIDPDDRASGQRCRLLAVDRPGIGLSSPCRERRLLDWPRDVADLADHLGLERFSLLGVSGGAPYALACAHALPERVHATAVVSGTGPPDAPGQRDGLGWTLTSKPWWIRLVMLKLLDLGLRTHPRRLLTGGRQALSPPDQHLLDDPVFVDRLAEVMREALRQGVGGAQQEATLYGSGWGFELRDLAGPVHLWHGRLDRNVRVTVGEHVAAAIPGCMATFLDGEGHFSLMPRILDQVLEALRPAEDPSTGDATQT